MTEAGGWSVFLPGTPIATEGTELEEAVEEFIQALREYAQDWKDRLRLLPNHRHLGSLVLFVSMSSDDEIANWVYGRRLRAPAGAAH